MCNVTQFRLIEEYAEAVLQIYEDRAGVKPQIPIDIEEIARTLKMNIERRNLQHPSGDVASAQFDDTIFLSEYLPPTKYRYDMAHEIAHKALPSIDDPQSSTLYGLKGGENGERKGKLREVVANRFAGALLMPIDFLLEEVKSYAYIDQHAIRQLARKFGVSFRAMTVRLTYLIEHNVKIPAPVAFDLSDSWATNKAHQISTSTPRQLSLNDHGPFYQGQYGLEYSEAAWVLVKELARLGIFYGRDQEHEVVASPREVLGRPFVIELAGTPNAGKDRQIELLDEFLTDKLGFRVKVINEGFRTCPITARSPKDAVLADKFDWAMSRGQQSLLEVKYNVTEDVLIYNRILFDSLAFLHLHYKQGRFSSEGMAARRALLLDPKYTEVVDLVLLLTIPPSVSISREKAHSREILDELEQQFAPYSSIPSRPQSVVNVTTLKLLNECYEEMSQQFGSHFRRIYHLSDDGTSSVKEVAVELVSNLQDSFPFQNSQTCQDKACEGSDSDLLHAPGMKVRRLNVA